MQSPFTRPFRARVEQVFPHPGIQSRPSVSFRRLRVDGLLSVYLVGAHAVVEGIGHGGIELIEDIDERFLLADRQRGAARRGHGAPVLPYPSIRPHGPPSSMWLCVKVLTSNITRGG